MSPASLTEDAVREALRDCYDPELSCNIVDLGLVHTIDLALDSNAPGAGIPGVPPRYRIHIGLILTTAADPDSPAAAQLIAQIVTQIQGRLAAFETISRTEVSILTQPLWTPERISPEGHRLLTLNRSNQPPQPTSINTPALVQIKL